jgi:predicted nuclease of predicted toxin-antitoxin system
VTDTPAPEVLFAWLYFDRHIMARLADDLRRRAYDVLTTEEAGLDTATDEE